MFAGLGQVDGRGRSNAYETATGITAGNAHLRNTSWGFATRLGNGVTDEMFTGQEPRDKASISRRNALKVAAAAGVGAAAFAGPKFGPLGTAPAYAVGCSNEGDNTLSGNFAAGSGCASSVKLNQTGSTPTVVNLGGVTVTLAVLSSHCAEAELPLSPDPASEGYVCTLNIVTTTSSGAPGDVVELPNTITAPRSSDTWTGTIVCRGTDGTC